MDDRNLEIREQIQRVIAGVVARNPAGSGLSLIGGFRYRLLDHAPRVSEDVDYHWDKDLRAKQIELVDLLRRKVLPEVKERFEYDGYVQPATGPGTDSPLVRAIDVAFWNENVSHSRIELPVEITRIACSDQPIVRTVDGVVYLTPSDLDMIESKLIALLNRQHVEERDFVDVFLFSGNLTEKSALRIREKLGRIGVGDTDVQKRKKHLRDHKARYVKGIQTIMNQQIESATAASLESAGGAEMIYNSVADIVEKYVPTEGDIDS